MIGRLTGKLLHCSPGRALLDVGGVGYEVQIPLGTFYALTAAGDGARAVSVHVHTHVREDAIQLFGFAREEERAMFEHLIAISGIGPRLALAVLSGIGVDELREAVWRSDRERLQRIPGVGRKTAERVLLELGDRLGVKGEPQPAPRQETGATTVARDALSALVNLGYARATAERAVESAITGAGDDAALEQVLRRALSGLVER